MPGEAFAPLYGLTDAALAAQGVRRVRVEAADSAPCRVTLNDAAPGGAVLLLNYEHQPADTPYRSRHAIFVSEGATTACETLDELPPALRKRMLSIRAFDAAGEMVDADLADGREAEPLIERLLARPDTAYLHAHYARRGCYAARIERA